MTIRKALFLSIEYRLKSIIFMEIYQGHDFRKYATTG
jgi:hypothetical protein